MEIPINPVMESITPNKSLNDRNEYRILRFQNGLTALLISTRLNDYEIDSSTSVSYSGENGPPFLRFGATARARNLANEVFYHASQSKKEAKTTTLKSDVLEPQDLKMTASDNDNANVSLSKDSDEKMNAMQQEVKLEIAPATGHQKNDSVKKSDEEKNSEKEQNKNEAIDEAEIESKNVEDEMDIEVEGDDELIAEEKDVYDRILEGDIAAMDYFIENDEQLTGENEMNSEVETIPPEDDYSPKVTIEPVNLGFETIPLNVADIERSNDEAGKLVFQDTKSKSAKNGIVSITFPVGSLSDHSSLIGIADLSRKTIEEDCIIAVDSGFETTMTTFTYVCAPGQNVDSCLEILMATINDPKEETFDEKKILALMSNYPSRNSTCEIKNGLDLDSWMLSDKKQLHLLYSFSKEYHPFKSVSPDFYLAFRKQFEPEDEKLPQYLEDVDDILITLWQQKYCVHSATLVLQSSEPLECLESIVIKCLGAEECCHQPDEGSQVQDNLESPFDTQTFAKLYMVAYTGVENLEPSLVMSWALSPELWKNYKSKPMEYIAWLISHKGERGLYSFLHEGGLITDIQAGCNHTGYHRNDYVSLFQIIMKLTNYTMLTRGAVRTVVKTVFSYLNFLSAKGIQPEIYAAFHFSRQINFNGLEPESSVLRNLQIPFSHPACPIPRISALGEKMQMIPEENLADLLKMDTFFNYAEDDIANLLISLDMDACNFMLSSKIFTEISEFQEEYYGTKYCIKETPPKWKEIKENDVSKRFRIPGFYRCVENSFNSTPLMFDEGDLNATLVLKNTYVNVWKKSNANFKKISAYIMHFAAPLLNDYSPDRAVTISILSKILKHEVDKGLDILKLTNLRYSIEPSHIGLLVKVFGFTTQATYAMEFILVQYKDIIALQSLNTKIDRLKQELAQNYLTALARTDSLARCVYNTLTVRNYVPLKPRLNALSEFTCDRYDKEIDLFLKSSTTGMLALGCCSEMQMMELAALKLPENSSGDKLKSLLGKPQIFSYMWPLGEKIIRVVNTDMEKDTVHVSQHFQFQLATPKTKAMTYLLLEIVNTEILMGRHLRKPMVIDARVNEFNSVIDFELIGSAWGESVDDVMESLNDFMDSVEGHIERSKERYRTEFKIATTSLAIKRSSGKSYHSVINEFHEHERKIKDFSFSFDHIHLEAENYATISRKDFYQWFSANFDLEMRKLTIQVVPKPDEPVVTDKKTRCRNKKTEQIVIATTGHVLIKPGPTEKHPEKFIYDVQQFIGSLNLYNPCPLANN